MALAVSARRRSGLPGQISDEELRAAHDLLYHSPARHRASGLLESLAEALLARGVVPAPADYGGDWWLWWPKKGCGFCQRCGKERSLTRYSNRWGKPYRYLCTRCRKQELADDEAYLNRITGVVREPGESAESLFMRRLQALLAQAAGTQPVQGEPVVKEPDEAEWSGHVERLEELLRSLAWAGWELPEAYDSEFDPEHGPLLFTTLWRTGAAIDVEYDPAVGELRLLPCEDITGEWDEAFSMLDETIIVTLDGDVERDAETVAERAGELGLLDATRIRVAEGSGVDTAELLAEKYAEWIFQPAQQYREIPMEDLLTELNADEVLAPYLRFVVFLTGSGVLPDLVPDAVALGIAAWCWRNNTAVEAWHLPSDVLMARVNIAATRAVMPHVDPVEGVDWDAVEAALTDPAWTLPTGAVVSELFGEGWPEVRRTVAEQVRAWKRIDEELVGPEATLRLLTIGGSTDYTRHWWGQGRWTAICRRIVTDAVQAGIPLPQPYDSRGPEALVKDLADPDLLDDHVLEWLIDMPDAGVGGPHGLRLHREATTPPVRTVCFYYD
ncbi:hypothetical protein [Carbonactinospora thermoautotrophica]|uniref:hypothetical protein n=1 Tax=Carbonactinospora thermoautotrophica TaxID=1469144 RepID=UPI00226FB509|nr:hypothetical protein [Carbonactinospora thermoautotrophica]